MKLIWPKSYQGSFFNIDCGRNAFHSVHSVHMGRIVPVGPSFPSFPIVHNFDNADSAHSFHSLRVDNFDNRARSLAMYFGVESRVDLEGFDY